MRNVKKSPGAFRGFLCLPLFLLLLFGDRQPGFGARQCGGGFLVGGSVFGLLQVFLGAVAGGFGARHINVNS